MKASRPVIRPVPRRLARSMHVARWGMVALLLLLGGLFAWAQPGEGADPMRQLTIDVLTPLLWGVIVVLGPASRRRLLLAKRCGTARPRTIQQREGDLAEVAKLARGYRTIAIFMLGLLLLRLLVRWDASPLQVPLLLVAAALLLFGIWRTVNELRALGDVRHAGARRLHLRRVFG